MRTLQALEERDRLEQPREPHELQALQKQHAPLRLIEGEGTREQAWLGWPALRSVRRLTLEAWLPAARRLVVVAPHPDDEILASGGLLALHGARGGETLIVAVTDGEASHPGVGAWPQGRLAATRRGESAAGLAALGLPHLRTLRLGLPDGGIGGARQPLQRRLEAVLKPDDLLVSTWRLDGHPDHEACALAAAAACRSAGCRLAEAPVWMWHWAQPGDASVPWHRLHALALPAHAQRRKAAALAAHASQHAPRRNEQGQDLGPVLDHGILQRARWPAEYFFI